MIVADSIGGGIQVIRDSDKTHRYLLTRDDGMRSPFTLAYIRDDNKLVVGLQS